MPRSPASDPRPTATALSPPRHACAPLPCLQPAAPVATPPPAATSGPLAGAKSFEDGSLLFTADMLQAVSYEDVLHPC